eukprot:m.17511 g.17511  ORF g.17511 m.17511 type:complete len:70 (+) comp27509_c0_seq4:3133-3342(+)
MAISVNLPSCHNRSPSLTYPRILMKNSSLNLIPFLKIPFTMALPEPILPFILISRSTKCSVGVVSSINH